MKIDIIALLRDEYPEHLEHNDEFVFDNIIEFPQGETHIKNMEKLYSKENNYIEIRLIKKILSFISQYGYNPSCKYFSAITKTLSASVRDGKSAVIMIDDLLNSGLINYYTIVLTWADRFNDLDNFKYCFINLIYLLDMRCTKKALGSVNHEKDKQWYRTLKENILQIASDCYWVSWCFMVLHEIGHIVLNHTSLQYDENQEYEADKFAYDMIINLIEKYCDSDDEVMSVFRTYTCFAPMMLLDFYRMIDMYQSFIYPEQKQQFNPKPQRRIDKLIDLGIDTFDISDARNVYNNYLDVLDLFSEQFRIKYDLGKLDILPTIKAE